MCLGSKGDDLKHNKFDVLGRIASAESGAGEVLQKMAAVTSGKIRVRLEHLLIITSSVRYCTDTTTAPVPTGVCTLGLDTSSTEGNCLQPGGQPHHLRLSSEWRPWMLAGTPAFCCHLTSADMLAFSVTVLKVGNARPSSSAAF